ncbi:MAG: dihydropteroate synthase [Rhodobacteraceae bacterium]|nr:dihydropteroate synthase [Paracoccaceae bacterium]
MTAEKLYYRPVPSTDPARPAGARDLAGGWCWFDRVEVLTRSGTAGIIGPAELPVKVRDRFSAPRTPMMGLTFDRPRLMGILNVTPDSFSDGGRFAAPERALDHARAMLADGADMLDIGGESTRPGAEPVPVEREIGRTSPIISALRGSGVTAPISIDTRKSAVALAALSAGASMVNDVAALRYDPGLADCAARAEVPVCLMHAQGDPATMQNDPRYVNVLLDVYDFLEERVEATVASGIARDRIIVDPGIGFGKTVAHNLALIRGLSLFHALGCVVLLGASRKRFIGSLGGAVATDDRGPGSLAVTLAGVAQGVQLHRVHDIRETRQALSLWQASTTGGAA